jgi:hypothetical protein
VKIFTHTLILYENGCCWKWKPKIEDDMLITINGSEVLAWVAVVYLIFYC